MSTIRPQTFKLKDGSTVTIRTAEKKDAPELVKIKLDVADEMIYSLKEPDEMTDTISSEEKMIAGTSKSEGKLYIVAEIDGKVVGFLDFDNFNIRKCRHNGLFSMYLAKDYRDKGIGNYMMQILSDWGKEHPFIEKLSLYVFSNNDRARALYEKHGWITEGVCKGDMIMKDGTYIDSILMTKFVKQ